MKIPYIYIVRNLKQRKMTTGITVLGVALVVFVFAAVLMMAFGIEKTLQSTGEPDNVIVLRKSATSEMMSLVEGESQDIIKTIPYIAQAKDQSPILSIDAVAVINLDVKTGGLSNVNVRGVSANIQQLRPNIKITKGRYFQMGQAELIVGEGINERYQNTEIGDVLEFAGNKWTIVGIFTNDGSGFESEIWGDGVLLRESFNRGTIASSVTFKMKDVNDFDKVKKIFNEDKRLMQLDVKLEQKYFEEQSEATAMFIRIVGIFITVIFSFGAVIGAMITMYGSVANRTREIGTLRALGFKRRNILTAFLIESVTIAILGGLIGLFIASFLQFFSVSTLNYSTFSDLKFSFALSVDIIITTLIFAGAMGFFGGFIPSVKAARINIVTALRG